MADLINTSSAFLEPLDYSNRNAAEKAAIQSLISAGSTIIEKECNRVFAATDYTDEEQDGNGERSIFVNNPPINFLTDINIVATSFDGTTQTTTYLSTKFETEDNTGEIRFLPNDFLTENAGVFTRGFRNVRITYNGGYSTIPTPIQLLCARFVLQYFDPTLLNDVIEKEKIGDYFYGKGTDFLKNLAFGDKKILGIYKIRRV